MQEFFYGSVLKVQREYSVEDVQKRLKSMKDLGMNLVVIWPAVYWWEDRKLPHYPYHMGHEILKYAEKIGMKVIMELSGQLTSLEYAPDFVMKDEYYAVRLDGSLYNRQLSSFGYLNYNHPEVKQLIHKNFTESAKNYRDYPALYGYDIWNETMFSSFDVYTLRLFREWLRKKYGTIEELNRVWDRVYYDWSQVQFTQWIWASVMPFVDYQQFKKENIGMLLKEWSDAVKAVDPEHPVIADNIHSMITEDNFYERPQNDWNVAENVDEFGISFYPKTSPPYMAPNIRWEVFTAAYSAASSAAASAASSTTPAVVSPAASSGRFWVSELQTHNQAMFNPISKVHPHELRWWNWEAISNGARGIIYWMWEPFIKGLQTSGRGLVDFSGQYTPRVREAEAIRKIIAENEKEFVEYRPKQPRVAILYDVLNHDFVKAYTSYYTGFISGSIYTDSINALYKCLWEHNIPARFITPKDLVNGRASEYNVIFASSQVCVGRELADSIRQYVEQGGTFIADGRFGMVDEKGYLYSDIPGGPLNYETGCRMVDLDPEDLEIDLYENGEITGRVDGYYERQFLSVINKESEVMGKFRDGSPAIIKTPVGKGHILYIASYLWYGYHKEGFASVSGFMERLSEEYDISVYKVSNNRLRVSSLTGDKGLLLFVFNYNPGEEKGCIELKGIKAAKCSVAHLYTDEKYTADVCGSALPLNVTVGGNDVSVYRIDFINSL